MPSNNLTPSTDDAFFDSDAPLPNIDATDEKRTARLSKTKQWKQVLAHIEAQKLKYQQYVPGVNPAITGSNEDWQVASCVVRELDSLKNFVDEIANGVS